MDKILALGKNISAQSINEEREMFFEGVDDFKFRLINPHEVANLTDTALDYLMSLRVSHKISEDSFEEILKDVSSIFGVLDEECLKDLLEYRGIGVNQVIN